MYQPLVLNLCTYSYYSFLQSTLSIDQIITFALNQKTPYVSLCDQHNLYGAMEFYVKATKHNLIPIIGVEIEYKQQLCRFFAKNLAGYQNLIKIISLIKTQQEFMLSTYLNNLLVITPVVDAFWQQQKNITVFQANQIPSNIAYCACQQDLVAYACLKKIQTNTVFNNWNELNNIQQNGILLTAKETLTYYGLTKVKCLDAIIATIKPWKMLQNSFMLPQTVSNPAVVLEQKCWKNLEQKKTTKAFVSQDLSPYYQRLKQELKVINQLGFASYFLIVADLIQKAKICNILIGPGRGSAAGSLVAFLLNITQIDPLQHNLLFERFLNPDRISFPDIDIDVASQRREELFAYLKQKYGQNCVAKIISFQRIKLKMAIRLVAKVFAFLASNQNDFTRVITKLLTCAQKANEPHIFVKKLLQDQELKRYYQNKKIQGLYYHLISTILLIYDFPKQTSIHAAGIVLSHKPLYELLPVETINETNSLLTQYSMEYLTMVGLVKIDLLNLTNLNTLATMAQMVGFSLDWLQINYDDHKVFDCLQKGYSSGIFQLESLGMQQLLKKLKPKNLAEIALCLALYRPGPLDNIDDFIKRKNGLVSVHYIDPNNQDILAPTYGILIYQEQVIQLVQKVANFTPTEADLFRQIISKKDMVKLADFKQKFFQKAQANNYKLDDVKKIYDYINRFADYGFNRSHAFAYAMITYVLAYFKVHYPLVFFSTLINENKEQSDKIKCLCNEAKVFGINVQKPRLNQAKMQTYYFQNQLILGLQHLKTIPFQTLEKVVNTLSLQPNQTFSSFVEAAVKLTKAGVSKAELEKLVFAGIFDQFHNRKSLLTFLTNCQMLTSRFAFHPQMQKKMQIPNCSLTQADIMFFNQKEALMYGF